MFLKTREIPLVKFRADLPAMLEPAGAAHMEIEARPSGIVNQAYMAGLDRLVTASRLRQKRAKLMEDQVDREAELAEIDRDFRRDLLTMIYETCVIRWQTNVIDVATDSAIATTGETFVELAEVPIREVREAFDRFVSECAAAGSALMDADAATEKN